MQGMWVPFLVGELRSHMSLDQKAKTKNRSNFVTNSIKTLNMAHIKKSLKRKNTDTISPKHGHLVKKEIRIISLDILLGWTLDLGNCLIFGKLVANWPVNKKVYNFSWDWIWWFPFLGKSIHYLSSGLANIPLDFAKILHVTLRWHQRDCAVSPPPPTWSAMLPWSGVFASSSTFPVHLHAVLGFEDTKAQRTLSLLLELSQKSVGVRTAGKGTVAGESRGLEGPWMWVGKDVSGHGELEYSGGRLFAVDYSQWMFIELLLCGRPCAEPSGTLGWWGHRFCPHGVHRPVGKSIYN